MLLGAAWGGLGVAWGGWAQGNAVECGLKRLGAAWTVVAGLGGLGVAGSTRVWLGKAGE